MNKRNKLDAGIMVISVSPETTLEEVQTMLAKAWEAWRRSDTSSLKQTAFMIEEILPKVESKTTEEILLNEIYEKLNRPKTSNEFKHAFMINVAIGNIDQNTVELFAKMPATSPVLTARNISWLPTFCKHVALNSNYSNINWLP